MKSVHFHHILKFYLYIASRAKKWKLTKPTKLDAPRCPCRTQFFLTLVLFFARWLATFVKRAAHHEKVIASASQTTHFFVMKSVHFHHILKFYLYIASRAKKWKLTEPTKLDAPRCPCRTQFFGALIFFLARWLVICAEGPAAHQKKVLASASQIQPKRNM